MDTKNLFFRWPFLTILAVLITALLVSCRFNPPVGEVCDMITEVPLTDLTDSDHGTNPPVFDDGIIFAYHGFGCAESNKSGRQDIIKVEGIKDIPPYATEATVFLNGWHLNYIHDDYHEDLLEITNTIGKAFPNEWHDYIPFDFFLDAIVTITLSKPCA